MYLFYCLLHLQVDPSGLCFAFQVDSSLIQSVFFFWVTVKNMMKKKKNVEQQLL